ncbi:MAG TPA: rhodanese-like domain-containing protein [Spirochaetota bacterium]|nr:rhodanese-like domain-containing protein [Spirochaetota bacterium]
MKKNNYPFMLLISVLFLGLTTAIFGENQFKTISTDQFKKLFDQKKTYLLIDARSPQEYQEAHIKGAISIPEKNLDDNKNLLPADKSMHIIIYCNGVQCGKSKRLAEKILPLGYTNISVYSEGIPVWEEKSYPIVPGPEYGKKIETKMLKPAELKNIIDAKKSDYVLVDVRDASEFKAGHIPTAINIPAEKFAAESGILPKNKKIIVYCNTGSRSYLSYRKLISLAYPDINQTLFAEWKNAKLTIEK